MRRLMHTHTYTYTRNSILANNDDCRRPDQDTIENSTKSTYVTRV